VDVVEGSVEDVAVSVSGDLMKMPLLYQFSYVARTRLFVSFQLKCGPDLDLEFLVGEIGGKFWGELGRKFWGEIGGKFWHYSFFHFLWIKNVKFCEVDMNNVVHRSFNFFFRNGHTCAS
jgi:hypothetical protein